jgi:hypothetical protein
MSEFYGSKGLDVLKTITGMHGRASELWGDARARVGARARSLRIGGFVCDRSSVEGASLMARPRAPPPLRSGLCVKPFDNLFDRKSVEITAATSNGVVRGRALSTCVRVGR